MLITPTLEFVLFVCLFLNGVYCVLLILTELIVNIVTSFVIKCSFNTSSNTFTIVHILFFVNPYDEVLLRMAEIPLVVNFFDKV